MRLRNVKEEEINFSGGINGWNFQAARGTSFDSTTYGKSHQMIAREAPDGYCDDIVNMDFQADGTLIQRAQVLPRQFGATNGPNNAVNEDIMLLTRQAYWDGTKNTYLMGVRVSIAGDWKFYTEGHVSSGGWTTTGKNLDYTALHYNFNWYLFSFASGTAGTNNLRLYYSGATVTPFNVTYELPGQQGMYECMVWKDRGWGISDSESAICYSKDTDMQVWNAAGGGGYFQLPNKATIKDYIIFNDQMYIMDSNNNIWVFVYYTDPGVDGSLRMIIDGLMLPRGTSTNTTFPHRKLAVSDNKLFVSGGENVFQLVNDQLYPIADQLHLELNAFDEVRIYDLGYGILLHTYFQQGANYNPVYWVYHHNAKAWTRYEFNLGSAGDENKKVIKEAHLINKPYDSRFMMTFIGSAFTGQTNFAFDPPAELKLSGFFGASPVDAYVDVWDGSGQQSGTYKFRAPKIKLKTKWLYLGMKQQYKLFREFVLTAWLGYRSVGSGSPNVAPLRTTIGYIPGSTAPDKVTNDIQVLSDILGAEYPYRVPVQQRARAVQLTFEWADDVTWIDYQGLPSATDQVISSAYISGLSVLYVPKDSHRRYTDGRSANTNSMST
jgi:hypothetical protein